MITVAVRGMQRARAALARQITQATDVGGVTVGIHEGVGIHPGSNNRPGTGETVAEVGAKNHFGSKADNIPARPWLDRGLMAAKPEIDRIVKKYGPNEPLEDTLHRIGDEGVKAVRQYIVDIKSPPNSQMTKDIKGSDNPLVDTGVLGDSIAYELVPELPAEGLDI